MRKDWNKNGKDDLFDRYIDYKIYEDCTKEQNDDNLDKEYDYCSSNSTPLIYL